MSVFNVFRLRERGLRGPKGDKGDASGPLGAGSVTAATISNDAGEQTDILEKLGGVGSGDVNLGVLPSGSTNAIDISRTAGAGNGDGTSQFYSLVNRVYAQGANNYDFVRNTYAGTHINTTGGTVNQADGLHQYIWLAGAGNVTNAVGIAVHIRADGPGDITNEAIWFRAIDADLVGGSTIQTAKGFSVGQIGGDGTKVTNAYCFDAEDNDATSVVIGYRSLISAGDNKYAFYSAGTAQSAFRGKVGIGATTQPPWMLTVQESAATNIADFSNSHVTSPSGIRIRYTGGAPNDNDHAFLSCSDTVGDKLRIYATGSVVNATNSYGAISDAKLKTEPTDARPQLADIRAVRLRNYQLKAEVEAVGAAAPEHLGVIAQELEEVSPGLVSETPDMERYFEQAYERGGVGEPDLIPLIGKGEWKERPSGEVTKSVNYSVLYLKAVKALQELADEVDALRAQIAAVGSIRARSTSRAPKS